jgi:hypothetical protein
MAPQPAERDNKLVEGTVFFAVFALLTLIGACAVWPAGIFGIAPTDITPVMLLRAATSLVLALGCLEFIGALVIIALSDH